MEYKSLEDLIKNPKFVKTLIKYEEDRGKDPSLTPLEAAKEFLSDYRYLQANTVGAFDFVNYVESIDENDPEQAEYKTNLGKLYQAVDEEVDEIFGEDASFADAAGGVFDYARFAVLDPVNLLGAGFGKVATMAVARPVINRLVSKAFVGDITKKAGERLARAESTRLGRFGLGAVGAAAIDAPVSGTMEYQTQKAEKELGVREDIDYGDVGIAAGIGGAAAGVMGGALSAAIDPGKRSRKIREESEKLLESTDQGQAAKFSNLKEYGEKEKLVGFYVDKAEGAGDIITEEYDSMGRVVEVDKEGNLVVEFFAKSPKDVEEPTFRKTLKQEDVKALGQRESDDRAAQYENESGKYFNPKSIAEGKEIFYQKFREQNPTASPKEIDQAFDISLNPTLMAKVNRAVNDMVVQDPSLMRFVDKRARVSEKVASVLENTSPENLPENIRLAIDKHGLTVEEFAAASRADVSIAAMTLGKQSQINLGELADVGKKAQALSDQDLARVRTVREIQLREAQAAGKFGDAVDIWRSLLVTQPATTLRNIIGSGALVPGESLRAALDRLFIEQDQFMQGINPADVKVPDDGLSRNIFSLASRLANPEDSIEILRIIAKDFSEVDEKILSVFDDRLGRVDPDANSIYHTFNGISRFFNTFNSAQDRAFKSAVFLHDLDGQIKVARNRGFITDDIDGIEDLLAKNRTDLLTDEMVSRSLDAAYKLTFQARRAGDRLLFGGGAINKFQDAVNKSPILKLGIPFPNFLANSIVFTLNRTGMGALKGMVRGKDILKGRSAAGKKAAIEDRKRLGEVNKEIKEVNNLDAFTEADQARLSDLKREKDEILLRFGDQEKKLEDFKDALIESGEMVALFGVALAARYYMGGSEWYLLDIDGESYDARPLFPLAPFLYFADLFDRHQLKDLPVRDTAARDFSEATLGVTVRSGGLAKFVRDVQRFLEQETPTDENIKAIAAATGSLFGYLAGGLTTPLRPFEDIAKTVGPDEVRQFQDRRLQENVLENLGLFSEEATKNNPEINAFFDELIKSLAQGTPFERATLGETDPLIGPFDAEVRRTDNVPALKQVTGVAALGRLPEVQKELGRLGINRTKVTKYTKTPEYDNVFNAIVGQLSDTIVMQEILSEDYQRMSPDFQKMRMEEIYKGKKGVHEQARNMIKAHLPVLDKLYRLESRITDDIIGPALQAARDADPNFSIKYVNEIKDPEGAAQLNKNIDLILEGVADPLGEAIEN
tara:strand:- start:1488 stop:5195 length:3708 start_codon:yes stop_codon:yes gene_type:complete